MQFNWYKNILAATLAVPAPGILSAQSTPPLKDIAFEPLRAPFPVPMIPEYIWWIGLITLAVLTLLIIWMVRAARSSSEEISQKINPLNIALEAIKSLEGRIGELEAREFSSEVSEIVRRYIEQACEIPAQEQTTEEFLQSTQSHPFFTQEIKEHLERFLGLCDMAKFAQQSVDSEQRQSLLKEAGLLVEKLYRFVVKRSRMEATKPPSTDRAGEGRTLAT